MHVWIVVSGVFYVAAGLVARYFGYHQEDAVEPALDALLVRRTSPLFIVASAAFSLLFAWRRTRAELGGDPRRAAWQAPGVRLPMIAAMGAIYAAFIVFVKWTEMHCRSCCSSCSIYCCTLTSRTCAFSMR